MAPESLLVSAKYAHGKRADITDWGTNTDEHGEIQTNVLQLDAQTAFIWESQRFLGRPSGWRQRQYRDQRHDTGPAASQGRAVAGGRGTA